MQFPTRWRAAGLLACAVLICVALVAWRERGATGYVEIKTVPVAAATDASLYLDSSRLDPIRQGSALLRQRTGTLTLAADVFGAARVPICTIVVLPNRITSVTVSVLERPPRCVCRFSGSGGANDRTCVS